MKEQNYLLRLFFLHCLKSVLSALSWFADFRQALSMYKLKFSVSSIVMPSMSTDGTTWICFEPMINLTSVLFDLRLSITMSWNFCGYSSCSTWYIQGFWQSLASWSSRTNLSLIEFEVKELPFFHLFWVIDNSEWLWMGSLHENTHLNLEFLKSPFLVPHFSYYTLGHS